MVESYQSIYASSVMAARTDCAKGVTLERHLDVVSTLHPRLLSVDALRETSCATSAVHAYVSE
jgi:hypothetical protein